MTWHHVEQMRLVAIGHPGVRVRKPKNNALSHLTALGECLIDAWEDLSFGSIRDYHFVGDMKNQIWTGKSHGCSHILPKSWPWQTSESMAGKTFVRSKEIAALLPLRRAEPLPGDGTIVEWLTYKLIRINIFDIASRTRRHNDINEYACNIVWINSLWHGNSDGYLGS